MLIHQFNIYVNQIKYMFISEELQYIRVCVHEYI